MLKNPDAYVKESGIWIDGAADRLAMPTVEPHDNSLILIFEEGFSLSRQNVESILMSMSAIGIDYFIIKLRNEGVRCMPFLDTTREFFKCAMCGEMKNMDSYIAPRGVYCGQTVCESCYESEFETPHFTCCRCNHSTPVSDMHIDSSGNRYCGKCCDTVTDSDYMEMHTESISDMLQSVGDRLVESDVKRWSEHSEPGLSDVIKVIYELNDSVRDLCALLNEKL